MTKKGFEGLRWIDARPKVFHHPGRYDRYEEESSEDWIKNTVGQMMAKNIKERAENGETRAQAVMHELPFDVSEGYNTWRFSYTVLAIDYDNSPKVEDLRLEVECLRWLAGSLHRDRSIQRVQEAAMKKEF
jgi:hypothetical protein